MFAYRKYIPNLFAECKRAENCNSYLIKVDTDMIDKSKIKIVKRTEAKALRTRKRRAVSPRQTARAMVSTVTDWVSDLKQRKSDETKAAIELLFSTNQRPSES